VIDTLQVDATPSTIFAKRQASLLSRVVRRKADFTALGRRILARRIAPKRERDFANLGPFLGHVYKLPVIVQRQRAIVARTYLVDGHWFGSTDAPVPQQEPPLDLDREDIVVGKAWLWKLCVLVVIVPGPADARKVGRAYALGRVARDFDWRREEVAVLVRQSYAEAHPRTDQFHPSLRW